MRTKGGDVRELSITAQVIEFGSEKFVIIIFRDVTGELKVQEMMIQSEKMISISGIAAGVAHEINNPLGIIVQAAQMTELRLDPIMERNLRVAEELGVNLSDVHAYADKRGILEFVGQIRAASLRASSIIRNMLDFSRTSSKNRALCTVASLIDKSLELASRDYELRKSYDFRKIAIAREFEGGLPSIVCVETEIEQVLINLFRNAAQAIAMADPPVEHPRIEIVSRHEDGLVVIEVADNGPGMPSEVRRRVFEPFFTTKPVGQGTGLGLPVSYFIITSGHGGQMEVFSKPGHGARFVIKLPVGTLPSSGVIGDY
jgi:signal transduction histidine kinase